MENLKENPVLEDFYKRLFSLKWTEDDKRVLDKKYIRKPLHLALETADREEDWESFWYILRKDLGMLSEYINRSAESREWNYEEKFGTIC